MPLGKKFYEGHESFLTNWDIDIGHVDKGVPHNPNVCELDLALHACKKLNHVADALLILTDDLSFAKNIIIIAWAQVF